MRKGIYLGTDTMRQRYGHFEDPKYGRYFKILAIQVESIDKEKFSDWIEGEIPFDGESDALIDFTDYLGITRKMGDNHSDWRNMKRQISDDVCKDINFIISRFFKKVTPAKDVVAFKIHYIGDPKDEVQIL